MIKVLRKRIVGLVRDEDGVALVVTLALFMFMYVTCAGVFAVGQSVKDRIILQNAVDAAAYSAAMVEADTLSRIATINRAMAWTYKTLVCSQMDWIAKRLLSESHDRYVDNKQMADAIGAYLTPQDTMGIVAGPDTSTPLEVYVATRLPAADDLDALRERINKCIARLEDMNQSIQELKDGMNGAMKTTAADALEANLPARIGDLCRWSISNVPVDLCLAELDSSEESRFTMFANESNADFDGQGWFTLAPGKSFVRSFVGALKTFWQWKHKMTYEISHENFDAENYIGEFENAYLGHKAVPLIVDEEYFPSENQNGSGSDFRTAKGAITVAVAMLNENPWRGITDGKGLYEAFAYPEATKWSVAISSAQAGYRNFGAGSGTDYSLKWDVDSQDWNLKTDDWNAVFVPVRKAFRRGNGSDSLFQWMKDGSWDRVVDSPKYVSYLEDFEFAKLNKKALPRMHNNGGLDSVLEWSSDDFIDLFYH